MRKTDVYKTNIKKKPLVKRKDSMNIDHSKLKKFCSLWSMNSPPEVIQKELNIKQAQYYRYINAAEEITDEFVLGIVDHGLVLQFRESLLRTHKKVVKLDRLADLALDKIEKSKLEGNLNSINTLTNIVKTYCQTEKQYVEMLDDAKIVNQTMKTLNKVIANNSQNKK